MYKNAFSAGALSPTPLGDFTTLPIHLVIWGGDTPPHPRPLSVFCALILVPRASRSSLVPFRCFRAGYGPAEAYHNRTIFTEFTDASMPQMLA